MGIFCFVFQNIVRKFFHISINFFLNIDVLASFVLLPWLLIWMSRLIQLTWCPPVALAWFLCLCCPCQPLLPCQGRRGLGLGPLFGQVHYLPWWWCSGCLCPTKHPLLFWLQKPWKICWIFPYQGDPSKILSVTPIALPWSLLHFEILLVWIRICICCWSTFC